MVLDIRSPVGAKVIVDKKKWKEKVPTIVTGLNPGVREVRLVLGNRAPIIKKIELITGAAILIQEPAPGEYPVLSISSDPPGATLRAAGRRIGVTPARITTQRAIERRHQAPRHHQV